MQASGSHFKNNFTFTVAGAPAEHASIVPLIEANAVAVINYLSDFIKWEGVLDFVVQFGSPNQFGANGTGLLPSFGGVGGNGNTFAAQEAITGKDANGSDFDAGCYLLPNANGSLTNYGAPLYFDPSPDPYERAAIPAGSHDFFSIFLHETMHSMGFWSTAQHQGFGQSSFDKLTQLSGSQYFFTGSNVQNLLGHPLALATTGSRDHYTAHGQVERGSVFEYGNYENNRWHLGQVELAVLSDLGYTVANGEYLPLVEQPDDKLFSKPGQPMPVSISLQDAQRLALLYEAALDRQAEPAGLNYWIDEFEAGRSFSSIAQNFINSAEFTSAFGNPSALSNSEFIDVLYENVLGRDGEAAGVDYWMGRLGSGTSRDTVLLEFAVSPENRDGSPYLQSLHEDGTGTWVFG